MTSLLPLPPPDFWYGAATGMLPMAVRFFGKLFMQERKKAEERRDEFIHYLMARDVETRAENKELRQQLQELQVIVGVNQQAIKEVKQDTIATTAAAKTITQLIDGAKS